MSKTEVTVYTARKVRTMDPGRPVVRAVAVLGGKVLSTGTVESMKPWLSRYDITVDDPLKDEVILPGFINPYALLDVGRLHGADLDRTDFDAGPTANDSSAAFGARGDCAASTRAPSPPERNRANRYEAAVAIMMRIL